MFLSYKNYLYDDACILSTIQHESSPEEFLGLFYILYCVCVVLAVGWDFKVVFIVVYLDSVIV